MKVKCSICGKRRIPEKGDYFDTIVHPCYIRLIPRKPICKKCVKTIMTNMSMIYSETAVRLVNNRRANYPFVRLE
jgi:hypothetical protein